MNNLFLASYLAGTPTLFESFASQLTDRRVLFIPTAAKVEEYTQYVDDALSVFNALGFKIQILDISKTEKNDFLSMLDDYPCLYISGGNTFYLLQELKRKDVIEDIKARISQGLLYVGESAGAIITAKNIDYVHFLDDKNKANELSDFSGLNLVDFYPLPHYKEFPFIESVDDTIKQYASLLNLISINNQQAIVIENGKYTIQNEN